MQTVILAAGEGTRMQPLTARRPKPMLPVGDRPLVAHTADAAVEADASRLVFVVSYEADAVREWFGTEYAGVPVEYAVQRHQRGTADAVRAAKERLDDEPFAVLNGDGLYDSASLERLYDAAPAVGAHEVDDPRPFGVMDVEDGVVTDVVEKPNDPPSNRVNVGAYAFPATAREWLDVPESERGEHEITDVLARVVDAFDLTAVDVGFWLGVGRPWELLEANEWFLDGIDRRVDGDVSPDAELSGPVVVEDGATVESGVIVEGPTLIRSGASVGPNRTSGARAWLARTRRSATRSR
ncbi:bifunctional UDP-N-acetylglucosamine pyrophosphorylase / Glucosamine-1-phosphate N-acetyltransferase [Halolamina pelagica]|uniref:Bifunctional UDP-N-acetylglucosamine pyrophosphorylase / Glucosamine-1-phosphate N-acetyltransferase n=1 Tax=Halolamina pelagica TaxID=699431 RepID=A0A1I5QYP1_9EURY|nr:bifunctional UDP-N-acetylglucosamine pyrophosphorylase / Glucosamine-1-phosphate N-acetyltransferase [Halolamina pelagica]